MYYKKRSKEKGRVRGCKGSAGFSGVDSTAQSDLYYVSTLIFLVSPLPVPHQIRRDGARVTRGLRFRERAFFLKGSVCFIDLLIITKAYQSRTIVFFCDN